MDPVLESLSAHPFEWCWPCARSAISNKTEKYKIFAWMFLQYANEHKEFIMDHTKFLSANDTAIIISIDHEVFEEWDIEFYEQERWMAKYYKFLDYIVKEHILKYTNRGVQGKVGYAFDGNNDLLIATSFRKGEKS